MEEAVAGEAAKMREEMKVIMPRVVLRTSAKEDATTLGKVGVEEKRQGMVIADPTCCPKDGSERKWV